VQLSDDSPKQRSGIQWSGIIRTLLLQVLVLLVLAGAFVGYVSWSSDRAWEDFNGVGKSPAADSKQHSQFSPPLESVRVKADCARNV
jgi:flagellar basal body-associated protein FliL